MAIEDKGRRVPAFGPRHCPIEPGEGAKVERRVGLAALAIAGTVAGSALAAGPTDLSHLSLEDLMNLNVSVTSAAKKPQRLSNVAAAAFVLTSDDIRRSGARSIPEVLRLVPGLQVARIDSGKWAISARGFNGRFANKLLVLMDGRTVYTPLFSGVFWDLQDVMLEDVERIEVIRGPGAALWGANAVNGVINVITKSAAATQGGLVTAGGGTEERGFGAFRFGDRIGDAGHYRAFVKYGRRDAGLLPNGGRAADTTDTATLGFRADLKPSPSDAVMITGGFTRGRYGETTVLNTTTAPFVDTFDSRNDTGNANILARWSRTLSPTSELTLQSYFAHERYDRPDIKTTTNVVDIEAQHRFAHGDRHDVVWGASYRYYSDDLGGSFNISLDPDRRTYHLFGAFVQDEIKLVPDALSLTLGTRVDHNARTGFEVQPNARLAWTVDERNSLWAAVSRAVRTPSRGESDVRLVQGVTPGPGGVPVSAEFVGSKDFGSESVIAFELGYRLRPIATLSVDVAAFYNVYDDLRLSDLRTPFLSTIPVPRVVVPLAASNGMKGETYGVEIAAEWQPIKAWRLRMGYAFIEMNLRAKDGVDALGEASLTTGQNPQHQVWFQSSWDLGRSFEADLIFRYVSGLDSLRIEGYATLDARFAWRPRDNLELALIGQNLLAPSRLEFSPELLGSVPTRAQRGAYAVATLRF